MYQWSYCTIKIFVLTTVSTYNFNIVNYILSNSQCIWKCQQLWGRNVLLLVCNDIQLMKHADISFMFVLFFYNVGHRCHWRFHWLTGEPPAYLTQWCRRMTSGVNTSHQPILNMMFAIWIEPFNILGGSAGRPVGLWNLQLQSWAVGIASRGT